jgi:hypothetical protein
MRTDEIQYSKIVAAREQSANAATQSAGMHNLPRIPPAYMCSASALYIERHPQEPLSRRIMEGKSAPGGIRGGNGPAWNRSLKKHPTRGSAPCMYLLESLGVGCIGRSEFICDAVSFRSREAQTVDRSWSLPRAKRILSLMCTVYVVADDFSSSVHSLWQGSSLAHSTSKAPTSDESFANLNSPSLSCLLSPGLKGSRPSNILSSLLR